jgi:hypothetical protein
MLCARCEAGRVGRRAWPVTPPSGGGPGRRDSDGSSTSGRARAERSVKNKQNRA